MFDFLESPNYALACPLLSHNGKLEALFFLFIFNK